MSKLEAKAEKAELKQTKTMQKQELEELRNIVHQENDFVCPICLKYIVSALSLKCGHTYCEICLHEYLLYFKDCPLCNEKLRKSKFAQCYLLDEMINDFIVNNHKEEYEDFQKRKEEHKDWKKRKQYQIA